jgi:hypothetical protein
MLEPFYLPYLGKDQDQVARMEGDKGRVTLDMLGRVARLSMPPRFVIIPVLIEFLLALFLPRPGHRVCNPHHQEEKGQLGDCEC